MNLSPLWVEALREAGIEAQHWSTIGDGRASDKEIFEWANRNGFFYALDARSGAFRFSTRAAYLDLGACTDNQGRPISR